jgi:hypothetical protein
MPSIWLCVCFLDTISSTDADVNLQIDRRIALINSNNIQDRVNMEMMAHVEVSVLRQTAIRTV